MKRFTAIAVMCLVCLVMQAIPAKPGFRKYTQPDGTTLVLEQKGDEWGSWFESASGQKYQMDADGYFHEIDEVSAQRMMSRMSEIRRRANGLRTVEFTDMTHGTRKIPVILVEFSDVKFTIDTPNESFAALLNQEGYNGYRNGGATGSVKDFYVDNSHGAFDPVFDVYGPVTLSQPEEYYGAPVYNDAGEKIKNDIQPELALYDGCLLLDSQVDFSQYDYDNDGRIDMVLFYYAGGSQAEGWNPNTIWPHQWNMRWSDNEELKNHQFDGKCLGRYFCTAELKGNEEANTMCSIGPTCHEFAHSLGLPDFYDTDYEKHGLAGGAYIFSTMDSGPYLNNSRTPPYFGAIERALLGWMELDEIRNIEVGENTLEFIDNNFAFFTSATADNEFFLYEKRGGGKWDMFLPEGMVVYHVDECKDHQIGDNNAFDLWVNWQSTNMINAYADHPCYMLICPPDQSSTNYQGGKASEFVFPGSTNTSYYCPVDWQGVKGSLDLWDIRLSGDTILFTAKETSAEEDNYSKDITEMGYSLIYYKDGDYKVIPGKGKTLKSCTFTVDNEHVIANVEYTDGVKEILETEIVK